MVTLSELLQEIAIIKSDGPCDVAIKGIAYDSRRVRPGFLFVAIEGYQTDGHRFIPMALEQGAIAVVAQKEVEVLPGVTLVITENTREALARLGAAFYGHPSDRLTMVGITGTNGKTTTAHLIEAILQAGGHKVGILGTISYRIGGEMLPGDRTTPESLDLQEILALMVGKGVTHAVMEVSSHALDLCRVTGCNFDYAIFTNITQDHLDFHRDMESYLKAKMKLFSSLKISSVKEHRKMMGTPGPFAIINIDDKQGKTVVEKARGRVTTYAVKKEADFKATDIAVLGSGLTFIAVTPKGDIPLKLHLTGLFNVYNTLAALAVGVLEGISPATVKGALEKVGGVAGRFETIDEGQPFTVVVDYAHTPDSLENVLHTAAEVAKKRVITVFGCGGDRDKTKRPLMGAVSARLSDYTIITSDNPRTEDPLSIIEQIEKGVRGLIAADKYTVLPDRREAIGAALEMATPGDLVMIAGKGHETYQIVGKKVLPFDDREVARELLHKGRGRL